MHESVMKWVADKVQRLELSNLKTLELGSYNVNGGVRDLFRGEYVGIDHAAGPGVDIVCDAHDLSQFGCDAFDVVVSTEMLEHDPHPHATMWQIAKVLKPGGHLLVTARGNGFPEHNNPDMFRYMPDGFKHVLSLAQVDVLEVTKDPQVSGLFGYGVRR